MIIDQRIRLLSPGPVTLSPRVRLALLGPDLCRREPDCAALQAEVRARLAWVYDRTEETHTAVLLTGSGTAAVEAMVGSLVPRDGKALVVVNGLYGERMATILQAQGKEYDVVRSAWTEPIDLSAVERRLRADGCLTHVLAVHHETTTGRLNDVAALGTLCRRHGAALLLDAVSSFGGERLDFQGWGIEACASTAHLCLHGAPGVCFVIVRNAALEGCRPGGCGVYLDLFRNYEKQRNGYPLFTPSVHVLYALQEALRELEEEGGWECRHLHYRTLSGMVRDGLRDRGVSPLLDTPGCRAAALTSFRLPDGARFHALDEYLKKAGYVISPGQQALREAIFQVAVMGHLERGDVEGFLAAFTAALPGGVTPCVSVG